MKRRANNEGSIFQRGDGRWVVAVTIDGKQKRWYCKSSDEATATLKELHRQQIVGRNLSGSDEPLGPYLLRWLTETKIHNVRQNTWEDYAAIVKNHILPVLAEKRIGDIRTKDIQSLYDSMSAAGSSPQVIRKTHIVLGMAFRSMMPDGLIEKDPTENTARPRIQKTKKLLFTAEQEKSFIEVIDKSTSQYKDMLFVYWEVGGRISEILGLKWESVFDDHILIENTRVQLSRGMVDSTPKTDASRRKVYLSTECIATINRQPRRASYVFCTKSGTPCTNRNWRRQWDQWLITAFGVDPEKSTYIEDEKGNKKIKYRVPAVRITPHALRHSQAVHLFQAGWTVADVQVRGGWDSPKVLQEIYSAHSSEDRQKQMAESAKTGLVQKLVSK